ncbi:unnamed protein product [Caenorhabditis brenneri]
MRTCLSILLGYAMTLTIGLRDYLKTTRVGKCFLSVFGYFYVRWRVMRSTSPELEGEFDSHDSSYYEAQRRRITRTKSVYNAACPTSLRDCTARQKPTCIEIYRQFMDYGSTDDTIPGHIFLSNSASYYASPNVTLCQVSLLGSEDEEDETSYSQSHEEDDAQNCPTSQKFVHSSYEYYQNMPSRSVEFVTYPEKQRRVNNYFFTKPMFFENNELRIREEDRKARKHQRRNIVVEQLSDDCQDKLDKVAKWVESESFNLRTESMSSDLASTVLQEQSDSSHSSDYRTVSISSPAAKEISERFSTKYWNVESHNDDGAIGARDNYHNRYFGKAGYYLTRNAIQNHCNAKDAMPAVEKRALQTERRRWTEINERGGNYDNVELGLPDTNGLETNNWNEEYEQPLPPHTCDIWKAPKRKVENLDNVFQLKWTESTPTALDCYMKREKESMKNQEDRIKAVLGLKFEELQSDLEKLEVLRSRLMEFLV